MQCPCLVHEPTTVSKARHARNKLALCASTRETASAVARSSVPRKSRLLLGGRTWYVAPRSHAEGERPLGGAMPLPSAPTDHNQRGTARARSKLTCYAASRLTVSRVARSRVPRQH